MKSFLCWRRYGISGFLFLALLLIPSGANRLSAQGSNDMRTAVIRIVSDKWPGYNSHNIEYVMNFPMNGGRISGTRAI